MTTTTPYVPVPEGFTAKDDWEGSPDQLPYRLISTPTHSIADAGIKMWIGARQGADGRVTDTDDSVHLDVNRDLPGFSIAAGRELVAALTEQLDRLEAAGNA
jgi:hypothetical protein